jgi:hypothetical protein
MILSRRALVVEGWTDADIRGQVRAGELVRVTAAVHGLPLGGADLSAIHLIRPGKGASGVTVIARDMRASSTRNG